MKESLLAAVLVFSTVAAFSEEDSVKQKIEDALLPLPAALRDGAEVFSYDSDWNRTVLRKGTNSIRCQAPGSLSLPSTLVAQCFHESWESAMVRLVRELVGGMTVDEGFKVVVGEIRAGKMRGPDAGAVLYELFGHPGLQGHANMAVATPNATAETIGLPAKPDAYRPWLMVESTPMASLRRPPAMVAKSVRASLSRPPPTVECRPMALLDCPPPTVAKGWLVGTPSSMPARLFPPPPIVP